MQFDRSCGGDAATILINSSWRMRLLPLSLIRNHPGLLTLAVVLSVLYVHFFALRAIVTVDFNPEAPQPGMFKIYWAEEGEGYSERQMNQVLVTGKRRHYKMYLGSMGGHGPVSGSTPWSIRALRN